MITHILPYSHTRASFRVLHLLAPLTVLVKPFDGVLLLHGSRPQAGLPDIIGIWAVFLNEVSEGSRLGLLFVPVLQVAW